MRRWAWSPSRRWPAARLPYDDDGEVTPAGQLDGRRRRRLPTPTPVVVDTDLGGDDLVALAFLLRHPSVRVEAVTIAGTGLVGCDPGVDLVADLFDALDEDPGAGRLRTGGGRTWRRAAPPGLAGRRRRRVAG